VPLVVTLARLANLIQRLMILILLRLYVQNVLKVFTC